MADSENNLRNIVPSYLVDYDSVDPSPLFTKEQIDFIESARANFFGDDLAALKSFEWFQLNLNWTKMGLPPKLGYGDVPGLRDGPTVATLYMRRYNSDKYKKMTDRFLAYLPDGFPPDSVDRCHMPGVRITVPNGDRYYPYVFNGNLDQWRKRLRGAAELHRTLLAAFDRGQFVLSDGQIFNFAALRLDELKATFYPDDW